MNKNHDKKTGRFTNADGSLNMGAIYKAPISKVADAFGIKMSRPLAGRKATGRDLSELMQGLKKHLGK